MKFPSGFGTVVVHGHPHHDGKAEKRTLFDQAKAADSSSEESNQRWTGTLGRADRMIPSSELLREGQNEA
jgi:hypothetical protein